jgi:transposase-like protein
MPRRSRRIFTPQFKARLALEALTATASQAQLCRRHPISPNLLARGKATLLQRLPTVCAADQQRSTEADHIAELERRSASKLWSWPS